MIDFLCEQLTGVQLPAGQDVMCNFIFYIFSKNLFTHDSASAVYGQLITFIKDFTSSTCKTYCNENRRSVSGVQEYLIKHHLRKNDKNKINQDNYSEKLEKMFDISHVIAEQKTKIDKDRKFFMLQKQGHFGSLCCN